ncbi:MAG: phosphotransferase, partial [Lewinellaceae bacterium]|nr:phosphotransferase [Lewinellaceae bacterium]
MEHGQFKPVNILLFVSDALPGFHPTGEVKKLSGGNLNLVWRVWGWERSVIVKYAPPHIATAPDIPLPPRRILMEAAALRLFDAPLLQTFLSESFRPPRLLYVDEKKHTLILEDVGNLPALDLAGRPYRELGAELGCFLGRLHASTAGNQAIAGSINNREIQQTRLKVQYATVRERLKKTGIGNATELGRRAEELGKKYLTKGKCLIMGDLWPRSILLDNERKQARLIDWEFAHYGRPAQDVAHFIAHL